MTDPSPNPLPREREIWIGRLASFNQPTGLAMTDPSPPEPRAHAWVQGKHTLSPGRGKDGLGALRASTSVRGLAMTDLFVIARGHSPRSNLLPKRGGSALITYLRMTRPGY